MLKTGGGGRSCIISIPANVAAPIAIGGMSICFLLTRFLLFFSYLPFGQLAQANYSSLLEYIIFLSRHKIKF